MGRSLRLRSCSALLLTSGVLACRDATAPAPRDSTDRSPAVSARVSCATGCPLVTDARALALPAPSPDSSGARLTLALVDLLGAAADRIAIRLVSDAPLDPAFGGLALELEINDQARVVSLADLHAGLSLRPFGDTPHPHLAVLAQRRQAPRPLPEMRLVLTTGAAVQRLVTPWARIAPVNAQAAQAAVTASTCDLTLATATCAGVTYTISPFAPGVSFGDFQSQFGTGASVPITITFSQPVSSEHQVTLQVTVTPKDLGPRVEWRVERASGAQPPDAAPARAAPRREHVLRGHGAGRGPLAA